MSQDEINATDGAIKFADQEGVDLATVKGSGEDGRISKDDVVAHIEAEEAAGVDNPDDQKEPIFESEDVAGLAAMAAKDYGIDFDEIEGSGENGIITTADVDQAIEFANSKDDDTDDDQEDDTADQNDEDEDQDQDDDNDDDVLEEDPEGVTEVEEYVPEKNEVLANFKEDGTRWQLGEIYDGKNKKAFKKQGLIA